MERLHRASDGTKKVGGPNFDEILARLYREFKKLNKVHKGIIWKKVGGPGPPAPPPRRWRPCYTTSFWDQRLYG